MKLIIAEKPMLARAIAAAVDGDQIKKDGYIGNKKQRHKAPLFYCPCIFAVTGRPGDYGS